MKCPKCPTGKIIDMQDWLNEDHITTAWEAQPCQTVGRIQYDRITYCIKKYHRDNKSKLNGQMRLNEYD